MSCSITNNGLSFSTVTVFQKTLNNLDIFVNISVTRDGGKTYTNYINIQTDLCKFLDRPQSNFLLNMLYMEVIAKGGTYFTQKCPLPPVIIFVVFF